MVLLTVPIEGSYCMTTDCTNTGSYQHGGLGLYLRVCCNISNLGQSVTISEPGIDRYIILCPKVLPKSCPKEQQKSCPTANSTQSICTSCNKVAFTFVQYLPYHTLTFILYYSSSKL